MKDTTKNGLLIALAIVAIVGWFFAFSGFTPIQDSQNIEAAKPRILYSYYDAGGGAPCIVNSDRPTSTIEIYIENPNEKDAVIDFILSVRNADVSWEASSGFSQSSSKTMTILAGTQSYRQTIYVNPHADADNLSLTLDAKLVEPTGGELRTLDGRVTTYYKNDIGNYCRVG